MPDPQGAFQRLLRLAGRASVVGGLSTGYFDKLTGTETQLPTDKIVAPLNTVGDISQFAANQALQNITSTALSQALGLGGSFGSALKDSLYNTLRVRTSSSSSSIEASKLWIPWMKCLASVLSSLAASPGWRGRVVAGRLYLGLRLM
ncbi:hypothetical protein CXG53_24240 [Pseudomonas guariconensis]|uniref:DUF637 domain-containing protein n=1 Tax=Pseudomonas guariconensis TaxID=1288410 RepID=A0AAX0VPR9_9PSED|nr:hypothetical protein CXG49_24160 [Pseudomonas guariconensis]PLV21588.1 hypothetical protein CXG53_24240 [Pseudomonas guariconensis]PLV26720.1 hypothetical protein CXG51_24285 [Pseudomonas guariconensis]